MKVFSKIFKDRGLVIHKYVGEFSVDDYKRYAKEVVSNPDWKYVNKSLMDFRETTFSGSDEIIYELIKFRNELRIVKILTVYLVSSPMATALTHLYMENVQNSDYHHCATMEKALSLLSIDDGEELFETILKNLKEDL